jgi:putative sigma-54 modulation protein
MITQFYEEMMMTTSIFTHNIDLTPRLETYVEKKVERLDRYMPNMAEVRVDLTEQNASQAVERQIAQVTVRDDRGTILRAEERSSDMFAAVDGVIDKLYRQIRRYRGKKRNRRRGGAVSDEMMAELLPLEDEAIEEARDIVRRKRFPLYPMNTEEAIDQMELLGHDFFVFFNSDEDGINVLYKRRDGNFGLLQPVLD